MDIRVFGESLAADAARLYNQLVALSPCCAPIGEEALTGTFAGWLSGDANADGLEHAQAFVVLDRGEVRGLIHAGVEKAEAHRGVIRHFSYDPGGRPLAEALLQHAEAWCAERGVTAFAAFEPTHRYPFWHLFCGALPDRAVHVSSVLQYAGYRRAGGEVFLQWDALSWPEPRLPLDAGIDLRLEPEQGGGRRMGFTVRAFRGEEPLGLCVCRSAAECVPGSAFEECGFVKWLGVDEPHRARQLGAHLLSRALAEFVALGYARAIISTSWTNYRAQGFYSNFGARVVDWTYWYHKPVADDVPRA